MFFNLKFTFKNDNTVVCIKSTIHPEAVDSFLKVQTLNLKSLVFNPEFLREGSAIYDFLILTE